MKPGASPAAIVTLCLVGLASACSDGVNPDAAGAPFSVRDSAGTEIAQNGADPGPLEWTVGPEATVVIGGADPDRQLYRVSGAIRLSDGTIVITNLGTNELLAFSSGGDLLWRAGGTGEGPGEFSFLGSVMIAEGDSIAVGDARLARVSVFDGSGAFAYSVGHPEVPRTSATSRFSDGSFLTRTSSFPLAATGEIRVERMPISVHRVAPDGAVDLLATVPGTEYDIGPTGDIRPDGTPAFGINPRPFAPSSYVIGDADGWIVTDGARSELQMFGPTGDLVRLIRWEFEPRPVTADDVEAFRDVSLSRVEDPVRRNQVREAMDDRPPSPAEMPYFGTPWRGAYGAGALIDGAGNIWLKEFITAWEDEPNRYMVFERTGGWLGTVDIPVGLSVLTVGTDYVLGLRTDELGVEAVELHDLVKGD